MKTQSPPPKITNPVAVASNESELNEIPDTELSITIVRMFKTQTARGKMDDDRQCENGFNKERCWGKPSLMDQKWKREKEKNKPMESLNDIID